MVSIDAEWNGEGQAVQTTLPDMPVVMSGSADPVAMGFAQSLARPGGKITGMSILGADLIGKHIELLSELLPGARAFAAVLQGANPGNGEFRRAFTAAAQTLTRWRTCSSGLPVRLCKACI